MCIVCNALYANINYSYKNKYKNNIKNRNNQVRILEGKRLPKPGIFMPFFKSLWKGCGRVWISPHPFSTSFRGSEATVGIRSPAAASGAALCTAMDTDCHVGQSPPRNDGWENQGVCLFYSGDCHTSDIGHWFAMTAKHHLWKTGGVPVLSMGLYITAVEFYCLKFLF